MPDTIDVVPNVVSGIAAKVLGIAQGPLAEALAVVTSSMPNSVATGDWTCDVAYAEMLAAWQAEAASLVVLVEALATSLSAAAGAYDTVEQANTARLRPRAGP